MTDTAENGIQESNNKPTHIAYTTRKPKDGEKAFWTSCGAVWPHKDGKGYRVKLDAIPVNGVIELRVNEPAANDRIDWTNFGDCEGHS